MRISQLLAASVLAAAVAAPASADEFDQTVYANVAIGWTIHDNERNFVDDSKFQYGAEWRFAENFAVEASYSRGKIEEKDAIAANGVGRTGAMKEYRLDGLYYFHNDFGLQPFVAAGVGHADFEEVGTFGQREEFRVNVGGGGRLMVRDGVSLRSDLRAFYTPRDGGLIDVAATLGFSVAFNLGN